MFDMIVTKTGKAHVAVQVGYEGGALTSCGRQVAGDLVNGNVDSISCKTCARTLDVRETEAIANDPQAMAAIAEAAFDPTYAHLSMAEIRMNFQHGQVQQIRSQRRAAMKASLRAVA